VSKVQPQTPGLSHGISTSRVGEANNNPSLGRCCQR